MHVTIMGKRWELRFVARSRMPRDSQTGLPHDGLCDPPQEPKKRIRIASDLRGQGELEAEIHELIHACGWHIDEPFVEQASYDIAEVLWRIGWRRP